LEFIINIEFMQTKSKASAEDIFKMISMSERLRSSPTGDVFNTSSKEGPLNLISPAKLMGLP